MVFLSYPSYRLKKNTYKIIVNTNTKCLHLYKNNNLIKSYPIAIGKPSKPTPKGTFKIINKAINPGGPFGVRWLGLSIPGYGIHGTNNPNSIGKAVSNGCIRMYNKDILELANTVPIGTTVIIT
ncbi:putative L,D-transpeptidase YkuD [Clostridium tepidiprofundi DSM 19306]|uniref:Putative L,D-transpeptidase YkuD n=1 Tax=Clostridium tepidiprofundi DSM 19306 TaxID=1121338 RepID=A0A151AVB0_9CLOT|nr:L,D-transpeptidase [Clostridium tepidiprofundi]KYH31578.1 putative L,D-transpeptidase YkuD [Clostridium tepidiprofundi DSM 19306]